jgi:hypothetical protein
MEDLQHWIDCTRRSDYHIQVAVIHGAGEPTLWKNFDQGIPLLKSSGVIGEVHITTNGMRLDKISDKILDLLDGIVVSCYSNFRHHDILNDMIKKYGSKEEGGKITKLDQQIFLEAPSDQFPSEIPCGCLCAGPMLLGKEIFRYCGPPVFDALEYLNKVPEDYDFLSTKVGDNYMKDYNRNLIGNFDLCRYCWANENNDFNHVPQSIFQLDNPRRSRYSKIKPQVGRCG